MYASLVKLIGIFLLLSLPLSAQFFSSTNAKRIQGRPVCDLSSLADTEGLFWNASLGCFTNGAYGGTAAITVKNDNVAVGSPRAVVNFVPGTGYTWSISDTGSQINITPQVLDTTWLTLAGLQAAAPVQCKPASGTNTLTCTVSPALGSYPDGLTLTLVPFANNTGPVTLDAGAGAVAVETGNSTALSADDLVAGAPVKIRSNGTEFRLIGLAPSEAGGGATAINDLTDVTITSAADGHGLTYASGQFVNRPSYLAPAAFSSRPAANTVMPGTAFYSTEISNAFDVSDGTNWSRRLFGRAITPPTACTNWTIVDGTVSDTTCTDVAGTLQLAGGVDNDTFALMRAVPAAPAFTVTMEYTHFAYLASSSAYCGVVVSNGTTSALSALKIWGMSSDGSFRTRNAASFQVATLNLAATASTQSGPTTRYRYVDDGTNRTISVWTGSGWFQVLSEGRTTTLTATHIGIGCTNFNAGYDASLTLYEYTEATP